MTSRQVHVVTININSMREPMDRNILSEESNENTVFLVMKTARLLHCHLDRAIRTHGVTAAQFSVMNLIGLKNDGITSAEIAAKLSTDRPTISAIIRRLEEKNLLKRRTSPTDRRAEILSLTEEADSVLQQIRVLADATTTDLEQTLGPVHLKDLRHSMRMILDFLE